jgi:hypothetical protein
MNPNRIDWDLRWAREDRAERHGRTRDEARALYRRAAKSAECCGDCGRALSATDSVTMVSRNVGRWKHEHWIRVPICLLCTLDAIKLWKWKSSDGWYDKPRWHRARCLNCTRPIRVYDHRRSGCTCCDDCRRAKRNERNKLRRRVKQELRTCIECGRAFIPKRADAVTCSNRCRQARHRKASRDSSASSIRYVVKSKSRKRRARRRQSSVTGAAR